MKIHNKTNKNISIQITFGKDGNIDEGLAIIEPNDNAELPDVSNMDIELLECE